MKEFLYEAKFTHDGWFIVCGDKTIHAENPDEVQKLVSSYHGYFPETVGTYTFVWNGIIKIEKVVDYTKVEYGKGIGDFGRSRGPSYGYKTVAKLAQFEDMI